MHDSAIREAVRTAWKTAYVVDADGFLRDTIKEMYKNPLQKPYANFCAIIQGSVIGKSRLMDKLAELVFMISMVLRPTEDRSGFPQSDMADGQLLFDFFCIKTTRETLALHVQRRYLLFLLKIIAFVDNWIDLRKKSGLGIKRVAAYWKEYIGPPLIPERLKMYTAAIESSPLRGFEDISDERVKLDHLKDRLITFIYSVSKKIEPAQTDIQPVIVFYFDETHHLTKATVAAEPKRTAYQCLYHEEVVKYVMSKLELRLEDTRDKSCNYPLKELIPPLAVRVDLTFQSNRDEAVFLEGLSVASLPKHRQYLRGEYPSKPFVAEAVARAIFEWCHTKGNVQDQYTICYLTMARLGTDRQGTREEFVAGMLCTLAHDIAILKNPDHEHVNVVLRGVCGNADVSFTQMIRVEDFPRALISEKYIGDVLDARPSNPEREDA
ncbi:hypothetical protein J132_08345 [Termitomyces sp. J132]|nr:hypothetical protein J132_08345 [Termitomyces sp. J132]